MHSIPVTIQWVDNLKGDFSFHHKWSYAPNVFKDKKGRLFCDGICPEELDRMVDSKGHVFKDSIQAYYRMFDTAHLYHTIRCDANCYEWAGTDYLAVEQLHDTIACSTNCNAATHCSLQLCIVNDTCYAKIHLNSIVVNRNRTTNEYLYYCKKGYIKIDKKAWSNDIMKAEFNFDFIDDGKLSPMYWKGKIYKKLKRA